MQSNTSQSTSGRQIQFIAGLLLLLLNLIAAQQITPRSMWTKRSIANLPRINGVPIYVIIHHTATPPCLNPIQCMSELRSIQADHIKRRYGDIGYNFLIGGDGRIYEGVGFGIRGAHAPNYNSRSIGIAFIGNYHANMPSAAMLTSARQLIALAVRMGRIQRNYRLIGHCQTKSTICPGVQLLNELKKWPNWQKN